MTCTLRRIARWCIAGIVLGAVLLPLLAHGGVEPARRCFPETGFCIHGRIRAFWEQHGGIAMFGLPIAPQRAEVITSEVRQVQWFERARLELYPANAPPFDVLIGHLGSDALAAVGQSAATFPPTVPRPECRYFAETGHNLCGSFRARWEASGLALDSDPAISTAESIALFGLPLSDAHTVMEVNAHGVPQPRTVQWFERVRFEDHGPQGVLISLLGNDLVGTAAPAPVERYRSAIVFQPWRFANLTLLPEPTVPTAELDAIFAAAPGQYGVVVYDLEANGIAYARQAERPFYSASLIKLPLALTIYRLANEGTLDLSERLVLNADDVVPIDAPHEGRIWRDPPGTTYTLQDLAWRALDESDNTASNMLLAYVGSAAVDTTLAQIGTTATCANLLFYSFEPVDDPCVLQTTPLDMTRIYLALLRGNLTGPAGQDVLAAMQDNPQWSPLARALPETAVVANKVGYIPGVEHDAALVQAANQRQYIIVVMSEDVPGSATARGIIGTTARIVHRAIAGE